MTLTESQKKSVLIVSAFAAFLTPFLSSAVNLALPAIGAELNASAIELGWVVSSFILSSAMFLLPFGRLSDIIGRKKIFTFGIVLFTITTFLIIFSQSIRILLILRIFQGVSSAMIFGTSLAIITSVFPLGERGRALGIIVTTTYLGLSGGPVIGGLLTQYFGWRSIFAFLVPFGIISIWLIMTKMKDDWAESKGEKFDWRGSVVYGLSLWGLMYGFSKLPDNKGWIFLIAGMILMIGFYLFEKRTNHPVFNFETYIEKQSFCFFGNCSPYQLFCNKCCRVFL